MDATGIGNSDFLRNPMMLDRKRSGCLGFEFAGDSNASDDRVVEAVSVSAISSVRGRFVLNLCGTGWRPVIRPRRACFSWTAWFGNVLVVFAGSVCSCFLCRPVILDCANAMEETDIKAKIMKMQRLTEIIRQLLACRWLEANLRAVTIVTVTIVTKVLRSFAKAFYCFDMLMIPNAAIGTQQWFTGLMPP